MKKTEKLLCVLLSIAMIAAAFASVGSVAFAKEPAVIASGECGADGGNLTWTLTEDDVLTVSGTGAMADYGEVYVIDDEETGEGHTESVTAPWIKAYDQKMLDRLGYATVDEFRQAMQAGTADMAEYLRVSNDIRNTKLRVVLEEGVTSVGNNAFNSSFKVSECVLPSTLKTIGNFAFYECELTEITLPEGLEAIRASAFAGNDLVEVTIPASVERLDSRAFMSNDALRTVTLLCDVPLDYFYIPGVESDFPFTTYEEFADYQTLEEDLDILAMLVGWDHYRSSMAMQYVISGYMTEEDALAFVDEMYLAEFNAAKVARGIPENATNDEFSAALAVRINESLGTGLTVDEMFKSYYQFIPSVTLYKELYTGMYGVDLTLIGYLSELLWVKNDYEGLLDWYTAENEGLSRQDASAEITREISDLIVMFKENYGVEATDVDGLIDGIIAKINSDLGKTGDDAYTLAAAGRAGYVKEGKSAALIHAIDAKFGIDSENGQLFISSYEISTSEGSSCVAAPWFEFKIKCDSTNKDLLDGAGVNYSPIHTLTAHEGKAATCLGGGWKDYETCDKCDYTTYEAIEPLGHDIIQHSAKAPTCAAVGWDAYETCSRCDYTTYHEIAATGVHTWGAWVETTPATATEDGEKTRTCSVCGGKEIDVIPATGTPETPDDPGQPDDNGGSVCKWCSGVHTGFMGKIVGFFHSILYFFAHLFGTR
ncbi:MAG: leucine-rich repeat domain-containing protein [Clostridia bacterium]|nr:leucine-rich repeat domain-containing protein [Clostridia bacterium]